MLIHEQRLLERRFADFEVANVRKHLIARPVHPYDFVRQLFHNLIRTKVEHEVKRARVRKQYTAAFSVNLIIIITIAAAS